MITRTLPEIPATPGLPTGTPRSIPGFLAAPGSPLEKLATEYNRLARQYSDRAQVHRGIANAGALKTAVEEDDIAHARAVRLGEDDPGPVNVAAWQEAEATARRAVAGARDAVRLVWQDLLHQLADPDVGGKIVADIQARRDDARARLAEALDAVAEAMRSLDSSDDELKYASKAREYAIAWTARPGAATRPDGQTARWPAGGAAGRPQPLVINANPEPVENVLAQIRDYRKPREQ